MITFMFKVNFFINGILGFTYLDPVTSNIIDFCSEINDTASCGLLSRKKKESKVICRFVSCIERHDYSCNVYLKDDLITSIQDYVARSAENITNIPENITVIHNITSTNENVANISRNVISIPENITNIKENITNSPENMTSIPLNITSMQQTRTEQIPDRTEDTKGRTSLL